MVKYISSYDKISTIVLSVTTSTVLASMAVLLSSNVSADSTSATATVTVGSACTMTATVDPAHTAEVPAGSTKTDIGSTTLNTICNDAGGYAIYAVGYSGDEYGNNKMLNGTNEINTGTGTSASNWNMSLSQVTTGTYATTIDGGFGSYSAIPSTYTKVAHRDSVTDAASGSSTTGSSIALTYGAYISTTQAAGDYVGKVKFTLVHPASEIPLQPVPCNPGYICYNPNGSNVVGTMGQQTAGSSTTTLLASNFSRTGYGFAGWSATYDYSDSTSFYGSMQSITNPADISTNGLPLYAIWVKSAGNIQNWSGCSTLAQGAVIALTDLRDGNTYAVAKLADGNCWMIENLRLSNTAEHNSDGFLAQGYNNSPTYGNFSGLANPESPWALDATTANSLYSIDGAGNTIIIGANIYGGLNNYRFPRYNNQNTASRYDTYATGGNVYSYGNYYTWHAAIADISPNTTSGNSVIGTSLCPAGWRLPTGGGAASSSSTAGINVTGDPSTYRDFYNLGYKVMDETKTAYESKPNYGQSYYDANAVNEDGDTASKALRKYPNNFIYSGRIYDNSVNGRGTRGEYWSSTTAGSSSAFYTDIQSQTLYPGTASSSGDIDFGRTIRCLVSPSV